MSNVLTECNTEILTVLELNLKDNQTMLLVLEGLIKFSNITTAVINRSEIGRSHGNYLESYTTILEAITLPNSLTSLSIMGFNVEFKNLVLPRSLVRVCFMDAMFDIKQLTGIATLRSLQFLTPPDITTLEDLVPILEQLPIKLQRLCVLAYSISTPKAEVKSYVDQYHQKRRDHLKFPTILTQ